MGKKPMKYGKPEEEPLEYVEREEDNNLDREIEILRKKLKSAVEEEDFEEAARLRDLIAELSRKEGKNA
jgi:uvrB/uvrC motif protein